MAKSFPYYQQLDQMDCGATCLRMIAKYYGKSYSIEFLRQITFVDREGVSLHSISDAAENIGFHTLGVMIDYNRLMEDIPMPCIAHWDQDHFVVIYKVSPTNVWVADPRAGKFKITKQDFLRSWASTVDDNIEKGVLLLFEATPAFYEQDTNKGSNKGFSYLFSYLLKYRSLIIQLVLGLVLVSIFQLIMPFLTQLLVDTGIAKRDITLVYIILAAQVMLSFSEASVNFIRGWILLHMGSRVNISLVSDFLIKLMRLPMRYFDSKLTGDLMQRISDNHRVETYLTSTTLSTLFSFVTFIIFGVILAFYNVQIFLIYIFATVVYLLWIIVFLRKRRELDYRRFHTLSKNQSNLIELINGMQEIKLHNAEKQKRWQWESIQAKLFNVNLSYMGLDQYQHAGATLINEIKNIFISFVAAKAVIEGKMTLGMMLSIQYIIGQLNSPIEQWVNFILQTQEAKISLERMNEIHAREDEEDITQKVNILPENGDLRLENVSFNYGGNDTPMVLKNINLLIPQGKKTAIVGTSGSGKTTILKLLLNFYQPVSGAVRLGDVSLNNILNRLWRSKCGVVMQDGFILTDTIANNIALGDSIVDKAKLLKAVKVANIQHFIESLPLGYNTKVGEDGVGLSQGQKQRLLIARAVYKKPEYIFFDEATNALDAYNEMIISDNLDEYFECKTVVIVAHRLSTVKNADKIVVIEKGEIIEEGSHTELTALRGSYYNLVKNQLELGN